MGVAKNDRLFRQPLKMGRYCRRAVRLQEAAGIVGVEIEEIQDTAKVRDLLPFGKVQKRKILPNRLKTWLEINDSDIKILSLVRKTAKGDVIYENCLD